MGRNRLRNAVGKLDGLKKNREKYIPGILGFPQGNVNKVSVPGRPAFVYVRLRNNQSEIIQAFNDKVALVYGLPVLVYRDETDKNRYRIHGRDTAVYNNWENTPYLPPHGGSHSLSDAGGGADPVWVYGRQFMPLQVRPSGTAGARNVVIDPFVYYNQDYEEYKYGGNVGTGDIVTFKPGDNQQRMVLIYLDNNGSPQLMPGDLFAAGTTGTSAVLQYIPTINHDVGMPLAAARLVSGTQTIQWANLYDLRPIITGDDKDRITILDNGTFLVSGTTIDFGSNLNVSATGTVVFVSANAGGDGGGGNPVVFYDDSVLVATGTSVSFDENLIAVATGTSVFVRSVDTNTDTLTYPAIYDDLVFKATGTHISFDSNLSVISSGTSVFVSAAAGGGATSTTYYDDGVLVATGTAVSFEDNLTVSASGSSIFVSSLDTNTDTPTYPAIYDSGVYKATGTQISFDTNLSVIASGTAVFVNASGGGSDLAVYATGTLLITGATAFAFGETMQVRATGTTVFVDAYSNLLGVTHHSGTQTSYDSSLSIWQTVTGTHTPFRNYVVGDVSVLVGTEVQFTAGTGTAKIDVRLSMGGGDTEKGIVPSQVTHYMPNSSVSNQAITMNFVIQDVPVGGHLLVLQSKSEDGSASWEFVHANMTVLGTKVDTSYLLDDDYNYLLDDDGNPLLE